MSGSSVAVVVPMYNEDAVVEQVVRDLRRTFPLVVCVDDGSLDDSAARARAAGARVLVHRVNLGQGAALQTGFDFVLRHTEVEYAVTFDADGQHRVSDAVAMVDRARQEHVDVVLGTRRAGTNASLDRRLLLSAALRFSRWNTGLELTDTHNGLRVLSRHALSRIRLHHNGMAYASELESLIGRHRLRWTEHEVLIDYTEYSRAKGQSNLNAFNIVYELAVARLGARS